MTRCICGSGTEVGLTVDVYRLAVDLAVGESAGSKPAAEGEALHQLLDLLG